jgi:hypothetical protein
MATVAKKKSSRVIPYTVIGALACYAIFLYTQPQAPTTARRPVHVSTPTLTANNSLNLTPQDIASHFPRYEPVSTRDPFMALVGGPGPSGGLFGANGSASGGTDSWQLTGINTVNGVASALIENETTGESVFLQPGDTWKGLRVIDISQDDVTFVNTLGQDTTLSFTAPKIDQTQAPRLPGSSISAVPGLNQITPLPALGQVTPLPATAQPAVQVNQPGAGFGGGRRGRRGGGGFGGGGIGGGAGQ